MDSPMLFTVEKFSIEDWNCGRGDKPNFVVVSISDGTVSNSPVIAKSIHNEKPETFRIDAVDALTDKLGLNVVLWRRGEHRSKITGEVCASVRELLGHTDGKKDCFSYPITGPDGETMGLFNFSCEWKLLDLNDPTLKHAAGSAMDPTHIHQLDYVLPQPPPPNPEPPARRRGFLKKLVTRFGLAYAVDYLKNRVDSIDDDIDPGFDYI